MAFFITKKEVQSLIDSSIEKIKNLPLLKDYLLKKDFDLFRLEISDVISNSSIKNIKNGTYFVEGDVINIEIGGQLIKISPKNIDIPVLEYDCEGAAKDYYERYPFVKIHQEIHGGTAWENYIQAGKKDGRTWDMTKCGQTIGTTTSTTSTTKPPLVESTLNNIKGDLKNIPLDNYGIYNDSSYQLDIPQSIYPPNQEMWDNLIVEVIDDKFLKVKVDSRAWNFENPPMFKIEISDKWFTKDELEKIDFSNQAGNDILLYCGNLVDGKAIIGYTFVHIKGNKSSKIPQFVVRNPSKRMPQFFRNFPDIKLNSNKKNIIQFHQLDEDGNKVSEKYFDKGFSVARSSDKTKSFFADYDYWCYENGGKRWAEFDGNKVIDGFTNAHDFNLNWIKKTPFNRLISIFNESIIQPAKDYSFVLLDWEAFGWMPNDQELANRFGTLFYRFYQSNKTKVSTYIDSNPFHCVYDRSISKQEMELQNKKYTQPLEEIAAGFFKHKFEILDNDGKGTGVFKNMGDYILAVSGDYMHFISYSNLYGTIQQLELCNLHNIESLTLNWGINEGISSSDYNSFKKAFKKKNGFTFIAETKPPTPCSYLENITKVSNLFGKGFYGWDEPLPFEEGYEHHGGHVRDIFDTVYLPNDFNPKNFGTYHYNAQIGYDYVARALNNLSKVNEYLDDVKGFQRVPFFIGSIKYDGDKLLPASAEFYRLPLVRIKKNPTKNELIIFAVNHHLEHYEKQIIKVEIGDKIQEIELNGQFSIIEKFEIV